MNCIINQLSKKQILISIVLVASSLLTFTVFDYLAYNFPGKRVSSWGHLIGFQFTIFCFFLGLYISKLNINLNRLLITISMASLIIYFLPFLYYHKIFLYSSSGLLLGYMNFKIGQWIITLNQKKEITWDIIFYLSGATVLALVIYYIFFKITDYPYNFLFCSLLFALVTRRKKIFLIFLFLNIFFVYTTSLEFFTNTTFNLYKKYAKENVKILLKERTRYGLQEVIDMNPSEKKPEKKKIFFFTDNASPSHIARKGFISTVQDHVIELYRLKKFKEIAIIGLGGGQDLVSALYHNESITVHGIEIDSFRIEKMREDFAPQSNFLFKDPRLKIYNMSARKFFEQTDKKFDLIEIQRSIQENYENGYFYQLSGELFTEEALESYQKHLTPDGILYFGQAKSHLCHAGLFSNLLKNFSDYKNRILVYTKNKNKYPRIYITISNKKILNELQGALSKHNIILTKGQSYEEFSSTITEICGGPINSKFFNDRTIFLPIDTKTRFISSIILLSILIFLLFIDLSKKFHSNIGLYFIFGISYEILSNTFIYHISTKLFEFHEVFYFSLIFFPFLNCLGYKISQKTKNKFLKLAFTILILSISLFYVELISDWNLIIKKGIAGTSFIFAGLSTGYIFCNFLQKEVNIKKILLIDFIGSIIGFVFIILIRDLAFLTIFSLISYLIIAVYLARKSQR